MNYLLSDNLNPYFNLAAEEYLLKETEYDFLFLYVNQASVVSGKHQNIFSECNLPFLQQKNILPARRISGGGTVFHDEGNLNVAFIERGEQGFLAKQKKYTEYLLSFFQSIGINAESGTRNEISIQGKKVSGCAEHVFRNRVLHHATLLFNTNLQLLEDAIKPKQGINSKAVQSVRSLVGNVSDFCTTIHTISDFQQQILDFFIDKKIVATQFMLSLEQKNAILEIANKKYQTKEWIAGYSPSFTINRMIRVSDFHVGLNITVKEGFIQQVKFESKHEEALFSEIEKKLTGVFFWPDTLNKVIVAYKNIIGIEHFF